MRLEQCGQLRCGRRLGPDGRCSLSPEKKPDFSETFPCLRVFLMNLCCGKALGEKFLKKTEYFSLARLHLLGKVTHRNPKPTTTNIMKLFLSALCASFIIAPLSFSEECEKSKCDKEKKEEGTVLADCKKCKDGDKEKEKEEGAILAGKCKDGDKEKEKEEGTLADCKKCKDGDKEEKEEGSLAGKCKDGEECDKDKEEGTLAGKCKDGECDKDKEEGTLA